MKKTQKFLLVLVAAAFLATACGPAADDGVVTIVVADNGWDSQLFHIALARVVVENAFDGFRITTSTASTAMNWMSMLQGDVDLEIESWQGSNIPDFPDYVARGDVVVLGYLVPDGRLGFYVPRFVIEGDPARGIAPMAPTLATVGDLARYALVFEDDESPGMGRIFGAIPGWLVDQHLYNIFMYNGLDASFNYRRLGSEATLFASLMAAYNLGQPWVGFSYEPAWISGMLDLVLLGGPPYESAAFLEGRTEFPAQELLTLSSREFPARGGPELVEFFQRFYTGAELVNNVLAHMVNTGATHEQTALWVLRNNDHLIDQWLPAENAQRLRAFLSQ